MKKREVGLIWAMVVVCFGQAWAGRFEGGSSTKTERAESVANAIAALREGGVFLQDRNRHLDNNLTWVEVNLYDEPYPLTLHLAAMKSPTPAKVIYLVAASSLNFRGSFFTPIEKSLAFYLAQNGYLVVGVTPREDNVPLEADPSVVANWGMLKHRQDVRKIIELIQASEKKPYDVLGHSLGAIVALDYASIYSEEPFQSVLLLDIPSFDPAQPHYADKMACARLALGAYHQLLRDHVYWDLSVDAYKRLLAAAASYPDADSGQSRAALKLPGNFTLEGLLHFSLIFTASMPGIITGLTDLPQEWPMVQGNVAGDYEFALDPTNDVFGFTLTDFDRLRAAAAEIGSGIAPVALARDYTSAIADLEDYSIPWAGIQEKVVWINGQFGMGAQMYGAQLIRSSGNTNVTAVVAPGYGHLDLIYSETARQDIWPRLLRTPSASPSRHGR